MKTLMVFLALLLGTVLNAYSGEDMVPILLINGFHIARLREIVWIRPILFSTNEGVIEAPKYFYGDSLFGRRSQSKALLLGKEIRQKI